MVKLWVVKFVTRLPASSNLYVSLTEEKQEVSPNNVYLDLWLNDSTIQISAIITKYFEVKYLGFQL